MFLGTIDTEVIRTRRLSRVSFVQVEGSEEQYIIKHVDTNRESEALSQTTDTIEWDNTMEWTDAAEEIEDRPQALCDDLEVDSDWYYHSIDRYYQLLNRYYHLIDRHRFLRRTPHGARLSLCNSQAKRVMRGQHRMLDQI